MKTEAIKSLCSASRMLGKAVAECARNAESAEDVKRVMELDRIATELKEKAPDMLKAWVDSRIDNLTRNNPSLAVTSTYLKRGARNYIDREMGKLGTMIDDIALFIVGDDGRLDVNTVFADMMKMLAAMDEVPFGRGIIRGTIGKGVIRIEVPDGPVWGLLFGNTGAIKLTADDFNALRNIVSSRLQ